MVLDIMHNKLVSIVIPVYNTQQYLKECIDSAIHQTYKNIEIILVDDGSTDNSHEICDKYGKKDPKIKVIHKLNGGASDARNVGLGIANGEYIYFLDSDDFIKPYAIETLIKEAERYSVDVVFFDANIISDLPYSDKTKYYYIRKGFYTNPLKGIDMINILIKNKEYRPSVPLLFIKRDTLMQNNLFFYKNIIHEDHLFTFMLFIYSKLTVHLAEPLYNRRIRKNSIMSNKIGPNNFRSILIVASEMVKTYFTEGKTDYNRCVITNCIYSILKYAGTIYYRLPIKDKIVLYKELKDLKNILIVLFKLGVYS